METFSTLLAFCAGFHAQRSVTRSFDVFFDLCRNRRLNKQSWGWRFETSSRSLWRHCNEIQTCVHIFSERFSTYVIGWTNFSLDDDCPIHPNWLATDVFPVIFCIECEFYTGIEKQSTFTEVLSQLDANRMAGALVVLCNGIVLLLSSFDRFYDNVYNIVRPSDECMIKWTVCSFFASNSLGLI